MLEDAADQVREQSAATIAHPSARALGLPHVGCTLYSSAFGILRYVRLVAFNENVLFQNIRTFSEMLYIDGFEYPFV